jgi:hypothetical protein
MGLHAIEGAASGLRAHSTCCLICRNLGQWSPQGVPFVLAVYQKGVASHCALPSVGEGDQHQKGTERRSRRSSMSVTAASGMPSVPVRKLRGTTRTLRRRLDPAWKLTAVWQQPHRMSTWNVQSLYCATGNIVDSWYVSCAKNLASTLPHHAHQGDERLAPGVLRLGVCLQVPQRVDVYPKTVLHDARAHQGGGAGSFAHIAARDRLVEHLTRVDTSRTCTERMLHQTAELQQVVHARHDTHHFRLGAVVEGIQGFRRVGGLPCQTVRLHFRPVETLLPTSSRTFSRRPWS